MLRDFSQESGVGENAQALEFTQSISKQATDIALKDSRVKSVSLNHVRTGGIPFTDCAGSGYEV